MSQDGAARKVAGLMTEVLGHEVRPHDFSAAIIADYGANSMDLVDIVERIEQLYGITIADSEFARITTFGDLLVLIASLSREKNCQTRPE